MSSIFVTVAEALLPRSESAGVMPAGHALTSNLGAREGGGRGTLGTARFPRLNLVGRGAVVPCLLSASIGEGFGQERGGGYGCYDGSLPDNIFIHISSWQISEREWGGGWRASVFVVLLFLCCHSAHLYVDANPMLMYRSVPVAV